MLSFFSFLVQLLAVPDYVVFQPNYRCSDNLGNLRMDQYLSH